MQAQSHKMTKTKRLQVGKKEGTDVLLLKVKGIELNFEKLHFLHKVLVSKLIFPPS